MAVLFPCLSFWVQHQCIPVWAGIDQLFVKQVHLIERNHKSFIFLHEDVIYVMVQNMTIFHTDFPNSRWDTVTSIEWIRSKQFLIFTTLDMNWSSIKLSLTFTAFDQHRRKKCLHFAQGQWLSTGSTINSARDFLDFLNLTVMLVMINQAPLQMQLKKRNAVEAMTCGSDPLLWD